MIVFSVLLLFVLFGLAAYWGTRICGHLLLEVDELKRVLSLHRDALIKIQLAHNAMVYELGLAPEPAEAKPEVKA